MDNHFNLYVSGIYQAEYNGITIKGENMHIFAIDIGGTAIKYGVVSTSGQVIFKDQIPNSASSQVELLNDLRKIIDYVSPSYEIEGIAFTVPAITDPNSGEVLSEGSMPFLLGMSIKDELKKTYNMPIHSENDGNCAALAEVWLGAGKNYNDLAMVVFGTGVGGAVIKNRKMHSGKQFLSGEFGYLINSCNFQDDEFTIWSEAGGLYSMREEFSSCIGSEVTGKQLFDFAEAGHEVAKKLVDNFYNSHAVGLFNIQYMYDPEIIVLGGAVSSREEFIPEINKRIDKMCETIKIATAKPILVKAEHGNDANLIGAVYHYMQKENMI